MVFIVAAVLVDVNFVVDFFVVAFFSFIFFFVIVITRKNIFVGKMTG